MQVMTTGTSLLFIIPSIHKDISTAVCEILFSLKQCEQIIKKLDLIEAFVLGKIKIKGCNWRK
jgi:hypothetical protein